MSREGEKRMKENEQMSEREDSVVSSSKDDAVTDLARRKLLRSAAWAAPLLLTVVSVRAYGAKPSAPPGDCEPFCPGGGN